MKNVLYKRHFREFKSDFYKYAVIFFIMIFMIGETSGFLVADEAMIKGYAESFQKYQIEDGNFKLSYPLTEEEKKEVENLGVHLYENFAREMKFQTFPSKELRGEKTEKAVRLRIFQSREAINRACVMEGRLPEGEDEIAVDRMMAENNGLILGDYVKGEGEEKQYKIVGLVALSDYSSMFESGSDAIFDASGFGVAVVSKEAFSAFSKDSLKYQYSYLYKEKPKTEQEKKEKADYLAKELNQILDLEEFMPAYLNKAITFTGEDMGSDKAMIKVFLYVVMAIIAFVFMITINSTIAKEAEIIGTLLASGYRKGEIILHYMTMPVIVTLISAAVGNLLGYTWLKDINKGLYYGSYSLPIYDEVWSLSAFLETTVSTVLIMFVITFYSIHRKLSLSPLKFLNHDLRKRKRLFSFKLSKKMPFFLRFRLRVMLQNMGNYFMLFVGVLFAYFLLMYGLVFPDMLKKYEETVVKNPLADYQYLLMMPPKVYKTPELLAGLITKEEEAEKFAAKTLSTKEEMGREEDILAYGIEEESRYVSLSLKKDEVAISKSLADKFSLKKGEEISLKEKYEEKEYLFQISEIYNYEGSLAIFMRREDLNRLMGMEEGYFSGYFSKHKLTDLNPRFIGTVVDREILTKFTRQLKISMGGIMNVVMFFAIGIFAMLIYLLTKTITGKNAKSISMAKIMGYHSHEIYKLYVGATTMAMIVFLIVGIPIIELGMEAMFRELFRSRLSGWIPIYYSRKLEVMMFLMGFFTYLSVSVLEYRRIKKVPMDEVLKSEE